MRTLTRAAYQIDAWWRGEAFAQAQAEALVHKSWRTIERGEELLELLHTIEHRGLAWRMTHGLVKSWVLPSAWRTFAEATRLTV
jgi:hypothetical protein